MFKLFLIEFGGEMVDKVYLDGLIWKSGVYKFEVGIFVIVEVIGFVKVFEFIDFIGIENIY